MAYECPRCNFSTLKRQNYIRHLNRKTLCDPIKSNESLDTIKEHFGTINNSFICQCSKTFEYHSNLSRHKKTCKSVTTPQQLPPQPNADMMTTLLDIQKMLQQQQQAQSLIPPLTQNTTNNITQNNKITINITSFGQEDIKHIESLTEFLTSCFLDKNIVDIIEKIHFDKDYPQNQNDRLKSLKHKMMETYVNGKWVVTDKDETLGKLVDRGTNIMRFHTRRNKQKVMDECEEEEEDFDDIKEYFDFLPGDQDLKAPVLKKLDLLFVNDDSITLEPTDYN